MILDNNTNRNTKAIIGNVSGSDFELISGTQDLDGTGLRTSSKPWQFDVARGKFPGIEPFSKFGHNPAVGAALEEVWDGSATYVYRSTATTMYISSDNTNDDQSYEVMGLDAEWRSQTVNITANGFNFVALSGTWIRIFRVKNMGSTDNAGNIYISDDNTDVGGDGIPDTLTAIKAEIAVGRNQTLMAIYPIKAGKRAFITDFYGATSSNKITEIELYVRPFGGVFQIKKIFELNQGTQTLKYAFPFEVAAKSDISIKASAVAGGGDVSAGFDLWLEDE